jgi:hypothetical protein
MFSWILLCVGLNSWQQPPLLREKAAAPQRIRVGSDVQSVYIGPGSRVLTEGVSDGQFAESARILVRRPEDVGARERIILFLGSRNPDVMAAGLTRLGHLGWMVEHHPEWDGFLLEPFRAIYRADADNESLGAAWSEHTGTGERRAVVLHNAAMFFAMREPERAAMLLRRAIALEPEEKLFVERLGMVYAYSLIAPEGLSRFHVVASETRTEFAGKAREALLTSDEWALVAGACRYVNAMSCWGCGLDRELDTKFRDVAARANSLPGQDRLPSEVYRGR